MDPALIIFFLTVSIYLPLAGVLLYVWHKFGKGEIGVFIARGVFLAGSGVLFMYMIVI